MRVIGIIPARFGSSRFPGKPLANIEGKTMIQRVYEQTCQAKNITKVIVATDCPYCFNIIKNINGSVILTEKKHENGTSRCFEAYQILNEQYDYIINIQGDEPFIQPQQIEELIDFAIQNDIEIGTQTKQEQNLSLLNQPNIVKVLHTGSSTALTFTRQAVRPFLNTFYKHIGLYIFKPNILQQLVYLPSTEDEQKEQLEQLRWLDNGYDIHLQETQFSSKSIDTIEDLL